MESSEDGILVTDKILWQHKVCVYILIIGICDMCRSVVDSDCNAESILAVLIYNN